MSTALFDLDDFEETRTEWVVLSSQWERCGLCGTRCGYNQGGTDTGPVCDACAVIDRCRVREHEAIIVRYRDRNLPGAVRVAKCLHCAWFLNADRWEDGESIPRTVDEVAEAMLEHVRPKHTSHWGVSHEITDHDRLVGEQAKRRAAYLRQVVAA